MQQSLAGQTTENERKRTQQSLAGIGMIAGPLLGLGAGIGMRLGVSQGPGEGWMITHLLLLSSFVLFILPILELRKRSGVQKGFWGAAGDGGTALALLGLLSLVGQIGIDFAVGLLASNKKEMSHLFRLIRVVPGMEYAFYSIGPLTFYLGMLVLVILLVRSHTIWVWSAGIAASGILLIGVGTLVHGLSILYPLGLVCLWIGLLPSGWKMLTR